MHCKQEVLNGDRLVIGGSHYFRISNPRCSKNKKDMVTFLVQIKIFVYKVCYYSLQVVDFQLAHQEILEKEEKQLRKQLDQEIQAKLNKIEMERVQNERNFKENMEILEMEKFKHKCSKEIFESEVKVLEENNRRPEYTPHKSTILEDIKEILTEVSGESLHKVQLMVSCGRFTLGIQKFKFIF